MAEVSELPELLSSGARNGTLSTHVPPLCSRLKGLIAAPFTALRSDESLNLPLIEKQAGHLLAGGVTGAFICGTTGEGMSLTLAERKALAEAWSGTGAGLKIVVHTGHLCTEDARALARHANRLPVHATAAMAPCFFRPPSLEALVGYCEAVAGAAPDLPFYYYHIPSMTGVNFPMAAFLEKAGGRIPNLAGVKFTCENLMDYAEAKSVMHGRYDILFGRDEILLGSLALGAQGAVGSTYNYAGPIYRKMMRSFDDGELVQARAWQALANRVITIMIQWGGLSANKAIMGMVGVDCGPVRLPLENLPPGGVTAMRGALESAGFFEALEHLRETGIRQ